MTDHNDFRIAVELEVLRWQFLALMEREFEHLGRPGAEGGRSGVFTAMTASDRPLDPTTDTATGRNRRRV